MSDIPASDENHDTGAGVTSSDARERGTALLRLGQFADAAVALREAVAQNPDDETSWRLLGGALASQGDHAHAVTAFERAVALAPTSPRNHYNLAVALQASERIGEAHGHLEQALALEPGYAQARATLDALGDGAPAPDTSDRPVLRAPAPDVPAGGGVTNPYPAAPPTPGPYPPPGAWPANAPPPFLTGANAPIRANVNGVLILIFGILSIVCCGPLGPVAWIMGNQSLRTLAQPMVDQSERGLVTAGRICGIIGTVFLLLGALYYVVIIGLGVTGAFGR